MASRPQALTGAATGASDRCSGPGSGPAENPNGTHIAAALPPDPVRGTVQNLEEIQAERFNVRAPARSGRRAPRSRRQLLTPPQAACGGPEEWRARATHVPPEGSDLLVARAFPGVPGGSEAGLQRTARRGERGDDASGARLRHAPQTGDEAGRRCLLGVRGIAPGGKTFRWRLGSMG